MIAFANIFRRKLKYPAGCDAVMQVRYPDNYEGQIPVTVFNFSQKGAILQSEQILINRRHIIAIDQKPELKLKIASSQGDFESDFQVQWYKWSTDKALFEISVKFHSMA